MSAAVALALASLVFAALTDVFYKLAQRAGIHTPSFMILHAGTVALAMAISAAAGPGFAFTPLVLAVGPIFGMIGFTSRILFVASLRDGAALVNPAIFRMSFALTATLAIAFLGEPLTVTKALGIAAAVAAVMLFNLPPAGWIRFERHTWLVLGGMSCAGLLQFFYKIALGAGAQPQTLLVVQGVAAVTVATLFARVRGGGVRIGRRERLYAPLCGTMTAVSVYFLMRAYQVGEASVVAPIAHLSFPVTGLLAVLFLKESLTVRKVAATVGAVAAIVALS
ncbi:MAG: EamA family transporter [Myxococcales bacterium]|nr:EamA family transporter [Myxococcales bacterium]